MHKFILKRLGLIIPVIIGVIFVIFTLTYITEGCPATMMLGDQAPAEDIAALRAELGLDYPFLVQFGRYVTNVAQLDFGTSFASRRPVFEEIIARFPTTVHLASMSVVIAIAFGVPLGILSATKQYTIFDNGATIIGLLGLSIPNFWLGMIFILFFSVQLGWLPSSGFGTPMHWILPSFTIGISSMAIIMRMTRSSMLEVIRQDYIRTARAKGQKESKIIFNHALKNALIPVITVVGLQFGMLLGGAILTETIYSIPGLGRFMVDSIGRRDFPIIQGGVLLIALSFSFVNLMVDVLYAFVDPRIRSQYK
ncbi:MAG: ABC transporter permease [Defluviitaleaceae bacterium]|nr:ABC transporter permease [Defluviitaleaceae bacterium]